MIRSPASLTLARRIAVALAHVDGDIDLALVRGDGDLGRIDAEIDVTPVEVIRAQALEVARELLFGILVGFGEERDQGGGRQLELLDQIVVVVGLVPDHVDGLDLGRAALLDGDAHRHAIAAQRLDQGFDLDAVLALREVLAPKLLLHAIEDRTIEHLAFREPDRFQGREQVFGLDVAVAGDRDLREGLALGDDDDQDVAVALDADIPEKPGLEERPDGVPRAAFVELIADLDRQGVEHGAGRQPPQALHADVLDDEALPPVIQHASE